MSTNVPYNSNPLASNPNTAIPFDITRPAFTQTFTLVAATQLLVTMPAEVNLAMVVGDEDYTIIDRGTKADTADGWLIGGMVASPELYYNLVLSKTIILESGDNPVTIVINCQTIWSALQNLGTYAQS